MKKPTKTNRKVTNITSVAEYYGQLTRSFITNEQIVLMTLEKDNLIMMYYVVDINFLANAIINLLDTAKSKSKKAEFNEFIIAINNKLKEISK